MNEGTTTNYMHSPIKSFKELKSNNNEKKLSFCRITTESFFVFVVRAVNKGR